MGQEEALERIESAARTGKATLDLVGMDLTSLPPEIGELTNLTGLNLSDNQLTSLPPEIGKLTNLTELVLSGDRLTSLPPEIGKLTKEGIADLQQALPKCKISSDFETDF